MTGIEKRFVNDTGHSRSVAEAAVRRLGHVPVRRGWSYLDVGCGNGAAALLVADTFGVRVVGVDVDPRQIELARLAAGDRTDVVFMTADATCLPFDEARFDIVATNKTTHHVPRWPSALAEMRRVLKSHGYLVYADLKAPSWLAWVLKPLADRVGVFTGADLDRSFASLQPLHRETGWLHYEAIWRSWVNQAGSAALPLFILSFLALNTVGLPLPVLGAAAGVAFGPVVGSAALLVAMTITASAQFLLGRYVVGERVRQRLGHRLVRVNQLLERRGVIAVAGARLVPMPFSEFNMLAGLTLLKLRDFTIGTIIGCAPKALAWSGIGALLF